MMSIECTSNFCIMAGIEDFLTLLHTVSFYLMAFTRSRFIHILSTDFI